MSKSISFGDFVLLLCSIILIVNLFTAYLVYFFLKEVGERIAVLGSILLLLAMPVVQGAYALTEVIAFSF
ncbi:hypothetical protein A3A55_01200 [Candidatus Roizmanbacteria bacterium RIFCSPLOWO2_01_FULL_40_14]|nr:MAG: hypothetical protein A3A55_01200 [Candidatus Roizmanbacteria bacterium RIFCSPLOWO2_01_FULL_40_14]